MPMQVVPRDGFVELHLSGRLTPDLLDEAAGTALIRAQRVLIDYSQVTSIELPTEAFVPIARKNDEQNVRVAVFAPTPLTFGWNRQVLQLADVREGQSVSVFRDRDLAVAWLRSEAESPEAVGGSRRFEVPPFAQGA